MKILPNNSNRLAVFMAMLVLVVGSTSSTALLLQQQQASAIVVVGGKIAEFQMLTAKLEKAIIQEGPQPHLIGPFAKLTEQLRRDVISAAQSGDTGAIRGIIVNWHDAASRILLGGPDTIPPLLDDYRDAVLRLFGV